MRLECFAEFASWEKIDALKAATTDEDCTFPNKESIRPCKFVGDEQVGAAALNPLKFIPVLALAPRTCACARQPGDALT